MSRSIADHFPGELSLLRDTAAAFARDNPNLAAALRERAGDPDVERLLEGVAFLTAALRARIDDAGADVAHALADVLLPHALRPLPAATVVELQPNPRALRARHHVPKGRSLSARPVAGTACRFRTCLDVDLWPLQLTDVRPVDAPTDAPAIDLCFTLPEAARGALADPTPLRLFLHHPDLAQAATLLLWLSRHLVDIAITTPAGPLGRLPASALAPLPAGPHPVFPWPDTAPAGHRSLLELFSVPERFCFVELAGLSTLGLDCGDFTVRLRFDRPPPLPAALSPSTFRLHCTPAINLFEAPGEPIVRDRVAREALLRADGVDPRHMEIYEVVSVDAIARGHGARRSYLPFNHARRGVPSYSLRRAPSPFDGGADTFLRLHDPPGPPSDGEILSLQLRCTNRALPLELHAGDLSEESPGGLCRGHRNLTPVSPPGRLPLGDVALWRLLSHLAAAQRGPVDADALRDVLRLYNVHAADHPRARAAERHIDAVRELRREPATRLVRGVPVRALRTTVELAERALGGPGVGYLFGHVLEDLFSSLVPLGGAGELRVALSPSRQEWTWPLRIGA
jgi:type VI secretion system protein ImpG